MTVEIACDMSALSVDERERHTAARETWAAAAINRQTFGDEGVEFRLPVTHELLAAVADFIGFERRCCPFFTFELRVEAATDAAPEMHFRMTGPPGAGAVIATL